MPRELKPCGTWAAYNRHRRRGEPIDAACAEAARVQKNERVSAKRAETAEVVQLKVAESPVLAEIDPLQDARDNLRVVIAAMEAGAPGIAALSKQRTELVQLIVRLEGASKPRESKLDELARRRADRIAAASH